MKNRLSHFAIYTEDIKRAKSFYNKVFNWGFNSYGQDDFLQIKSNTSEDGALIGALQSRKYSPVPDKIIGLECTIAVEDIDAVIEKVKEAGGSILLDKTEIPHVGFICKFLDTEGNLLCAMEYSKR